MMTQRQEYFRTVFVAVAEGGRFVDGLGKARDMLPDDQSFNAYMAVMNGHRIEDALRKAMTKAERADFDRVRAAALLTLGGKPWEHEHISNCIGLLALAVDRDARPAATRAVVDHLSKIKDVGDMRFLIMIAEAAIEESRSLLAKAEIFRIAEDVTIEKRGHGRWCVCVFSSVLNKDGAREHEPNPSSRDEAFIARTRFTLDEAFLRAEAYVLRETATARPE